MVPWEMGNNRTVALAPGARYQGGKEKYPTCDIDSAIARPFNCSEVGMSLLMDRNYPRLILPSRYIISRSDLYELYTDSYGSESIERNELNARLLRNCAEIWEAVKGILCLDSPEGHSMDDEDDGDGLNVGFKDSLSFSWRALKEAR